MDKLKISTVAAFIAGSMLVSIAPSFGAQRNVWGRHIGSRITSEATMPVISGHEDQRVRTEPENSQGAPSNLGKKIDQEGQTDLFKHEHFGFSALWEETIPEGNRYSFEGMIPIEGEDLKNYDLLKKLEECFGFSMNLSQAKFSNESMGMDLKKATMVLTLISVLKEILEKSENSPITFEKILEECKNHRHIAESEINRGLENGDPFAYFVENHNNLAGFQGNQLEPIAVLVLDVFGGNGPGPFENFFQKLTAYDLSGNRAELTAEENDDSNIQRLLKMGNISMQTEKGGELWIPDWKNRHRNKKLLFFITCANGLYAVKFFRERAIYGKEIAASASNWWKYALGAGGLAAGMFFIGTSD